MKRKFTSLLFIVLLIAPVMATYGWLRHHKAEVRHDVKRQMEAGMDREELVLLKFSREDAEKQLHWEHAKEFEYQQEMYDVVEKEEVGDSLYYWCWWDHKETKLNRHLADLVSRILHSDPESKDCQDRLATYFQSLYCSAASPWNSGAEAVGAAQISPEIWAISAAAHAPPTPPPLYQLDA